MRKLIYIVLVVAVIGGCNEKTESTGKKFRVSGKLTNSKATMIFLEEIPMATMRRTVVDSSKIDSNGNYELNTSSETEKIYSISLDKNLYPIVTLVNDTTTVIVNASFNDNGNERVDSYDVTGSTGSQKLKKFLTGFGNALLDLYKSDILVDSLSRSNAADSNINRLIQKRNQSATDLKNNSLLAMENANNPALAMYMLGFYQTSRNENPQFKLSAIDDSEVTAIVNTIAAKFPSNKDVASLKNQLDDQKKHLEEQMAATQQWIGKPAPEIIMPDPSGKEISLSSFKGKYVLVDFWASWCRPCRDENPNVVAAYQQFKNKNFTILGVSLDKNKSAWTKAIMKDGLTWQHISDLKEWNSPVIPLYNISGIPFSVLVNPEGNIVAQNLRGIELQRKLEEILK